MAKLQATMEHARRTLPSAAPVAPPASMPIAASPRPDEADIGERLKRLDLDQLEQVTEGLGRWSAPRDEEALRQSLLAFVDEWADDVVEEKEDDSDAVRAAGRNEAVGNIEQEMFRAIADTAPRSEWREAMGVSDDRLQELIDRAIENGVDLPDEEAAHTA